MGDPVGTQGATQGGAVDPAVLGRLKLALGLDVDAARDEAQRKLQAAAIFLKEAEALKTLAENAKVAADEYAASVRSAADEYVSKAHQSAEAMHAAAANA